MLESVMKSAEAANREESGDYIGNDGLLYCGKCRTPKQYRLPESAPFSGVYPIQCKCSKSRTEKQEAAEREPHKNAETERRRAAAFGRKKCIKHRFEHSEEGGKPLSMARKYVEIFPQILPKGYGLTLYGMPESGKTFIAACIGNALIDAGYSVLFVNVTELTALQTAEEQKALRDSIECCDLFVLDDLGAERKTEYAAERVYSAVDTRYNTGKPMIVTTNYTKEILLGGSSVEMHRYFSRILENNLLLEVSGARHRAKKHTNAVEELQRLLE